MKRLIKVFIIFIMVILFSSQNIIDLNKNYNFDDVLQYYNYSTFDFGNIFGHNVLRILLGEKDLLDYGIDTFSLALLDNRHLRLLRNMVYAKHGYIFQSSDLREYFNRFDWYTPTSNNVENVLTEFDRYTIRYIQAFENKNENLPDVIWGDNKVGVWQDIPIMAAGWSERYVIYPDNNLEYYYSQMRQLPINLGMSGNYTIRGNILKYYVNKIFYIMHDFNIGIDPHGYTWDNSEINTIILERPIIYEIPVSNIESKEVDFFHRKDIQRDIITIGGQEFYKLSSNVNDKF